MNITLHFYDTTTGLFLGRTFTGSESMNDQMQGELITANTPQGAGALEAPQGAIDHLSQKVDLTQLPPLRAAHESAHADRVAQTANAFAAATNLDALKAAHATRVAEHDTLVAGLRNAEEIDQDRLRQALSEHEKACTIFEDTVREVQARKAPPAPPIPPFIAPAHVVIDHQPPQPSPDHEWNVDTKRWVLSAAAQARIDAAARAVARCAELIAEQHDWTRRLALDPNSATARAALESIDDELKALGS